MKPKVIRAPVEPIYHEMGAFIADARRKLGMKQEELAQAIEMSRSAVASMEAGRHRILIHHLMNIEEVLNIDVYQRYKQ